MVWVVVAVEASEKAEDLTSLVSDAGVGCQGDDEGKTQVDEKGVEDWGKTWRKGKETRL